MKQLQVLDRELHVHQPAVSGFGIQLFLGLARNLSGHSLAKPVDLGRGIGRQRALVNQL